MVGSLERYIWPSCFSCQSGLQARRQFAKRSRSTCRVLYYCDAAGDCPEDMPATSIQPGVAANVFAVIGNTAQAPLVETPSGLPDLARESIQGVLTGCSSWSPQDFCWAETCGELPHRTGWASLHTLSIVIVVTAHLCYLCCMHYNCGCCWRGVGDQQ